MKKHVSNLSVVLPCLNESKTIEICILKAFESIKNLQIAGEIIVADNGSIDGSQALAKNLSARVINVVQKGYGAALQAGISAAKYEYIVIADSDNTYAIDNLTPFVEQLELGAKLVIGNRFKGGIEKGAMPFLHKYLGVPILSLIGKLLFEVPINDFHCGLRAFEKKAISDLKLECVGMEFASEIIVKASASNLKIVEVPTTLSRSYLNRKPHLRTWRDGWRHLIFLIKFGNRKAFFYLAVLSTILICNYLLIFFHTISQ